MTKPGQGRGNRPSIEARALITTRRSQAIDLRHAGLDLVTVGRTLRYGKWDGDVQITTDASLAAIVSNDVQRGLADRRAHLHASVDEYVRGMTERLERLRSAVWAKAMTGSPAHVREARAIEEQLARLHGLNKPVRHEVAVGDVAVEVEAALSELLELLGVAEQPRVVEGATVTAFPVRAIEGGS